MEVNFKINEEYLISHVLYSTSMDRFSSQEHRETIVSLQNKAWEISQNSYNFLVGRFFPEAILDFNLENIIEIFRNSFDLLRVLKESLEYKTLLQHVNDYRERIMEQWKLKYDKTIKIMHEMTGISFENDKFVVYLTLPSLKNGRYLGNKRIAWGHSEDFNNYSIIYLWHEIMHDKLYSDDIGHSIIQLATDNELRIRLNGGQYPEFIGHAELFPTMTKILPYWREYLKSENKNILNFEKLMREKSKE